MRNNILPALVLSLAWGVPARAADYVVTTLADTGDGSLRQRVETANATAGAPHSITFDSGLRGNIALTSPIRIRESMTITGPGADVVVLDGGDATRLLHVQNTNGVRRTVTVSGLAFVRGHAVTDGGNGGALYGYGDDLRIHDSRFEGNRATRDGGAIWFAEGDLELKGVHLVGNRVPATDTGQGGAVYFSAGTITIDDSLVKDNHAYAGGGLRLLSPRAHALVRNSLIEGNTAGSFGGGINATTMTSFRLSGSALVGNKVDETLGGGLYWSGSDGVGASEGIIENTTFSANESLHRSGVGSALAIAKGLMTIRNSTFARNRAAPDHPIPSNSGAGALWVASTAATATLHSTLFDENTNGMTGQFGDIVHQSTSTTNPSVVHAKNSSFRTMPGSGTINGDDQDNLFATESGLGPLTTMHGGGFVPVHPIPADSPVVDRGGNPANLAWDQRGTGFVRAAWSDPIRPGIGGPRPDIGAYEFRGDGIFFDSFEKNAGVQALRQSAAVYHFPPASAVAVGASGSPGASRPETSSADRESRQSGYLTGVVRNFAGRPLSGAKVIADHSIFFNSNLSTTTGADGNYAIRLSVGSWYAFAQHQANYNGKAYTLWLHPDDSSGFGGEGAVRNFTWKLAGVMPEPLSGHYGGLVTFDHYPGVYIEDDQIEFTFRPVGPLIDGSAGTVLTLRAADGYRIKDVPIGRYDVSATYQGSRLLLRTWNSEEAFVSSYRLDFEPQIPAQCDNCAMLEYTLAGDSIFGNGFEPS